MAQEPGTCCRVTANGPRGQQRHVGGAQAENPTLLRRRGSLAAHPEAGETAVGSAGRRAPLCLRCLEPFRDRGQPSTGTCCSGRRLGGDGVTVMLGP